LLFKLFANTATKNHLLYFYILPSIALFDLIQRQGMEMIPGGLDGWEAVNELGGIFDGFQFGSVWQDTPVFTRRY